MQIGNYSTPEYKVIPEATNFYWELTRGIGSSYVYNQKEMEEDYLSVSQLIRMFVDVVSKNGNMLLNVRPKADGTLAEPQVGRLKGLGDWLGVNGEAKYGTRPWVAAEGKCREGNDVCFTMKDDNVYAIILGDIKSEVTIELLNIREGAQVRLLGYNANLEWEQKVLDVKIKLFEILLESSAYTKK